MKAAIKKVFPLLCLFTGIIFLIIRLFIVGSAGTDIAGIEQNVIYSIQQLLADTGELYTSPSAAPFSITQYTPFYYYICGFTAKLFGLQSSDIKCLYLIGRSWNLLFNIMTALTVFSISRSVLRLPENKSYLLFILSFTLVLSHNFAVRPDSLTDLCGIASVYCFMRYHQQKENGKTHLLLFTISFTAIALFSKQSGIQLLLIFVGFSLLRKDWKTLIKLLLFSALIYGGLLLIFINVYSSFLENVVGGIANGLSIENFITIMLRNVVLVSIWPAIFLSLVILIKNNSILKGSETERLLAVCTLGTLIFATVTALKMGSTPQYFVLFMNLGMLLIINEIHHHPIKDMSSTGPIAGNRHLILYYYMGLCVFIYAIADIKLIRYHGEYLQQQRLSALSTADFIRKNGGENSGKYIFFNLSTDTTIPSRQGLNNLFYKNCLLPQIDILQYSAGPSKVIGYKNLERLISTGQVRYIVESEPRSAFSILKNLTSLRNQKFSLIKTIDGYLIYKLLPN